MTFILFLSQYILIPTLNTPHIKRFISSIQNTRISPKNLFFHNNFSFPSTFIFLKYFQHLEKIFKSKPSTLYHMNQHQSLIQNTRIFSFFIFSLRAWYTFYPRHTTCETIRNTKKLNLMINSKFSSPMSVKKPIDYEMLKIGKCPLITDPYGFQVLIPLMNFI